MSESEITLWIERCQQGGDEAIKNVQKKLKRIKREMELAPVDKLSKYIIPRLGSRPKHHCVGTVVLGRTHAGISPYSDHAIDLQ